MALPKLSAQQPIVNPDGGPSSPFLQFMEKARTEQIATDAAQDATDAALAAAIADIVAAQAAADAAQADADTAIANAATALTTANTANTNATAVQTEVDGLVAGTDAFTAINVGGTTIASGTGLAAGVVTTAAIAADDISDYASAFTEANLAWSGAGYDEAQTVTLTTEGGRVEVNASIIFSATSPATQVTALMSIERDGVAIYGPYTMATTTTDAAGAQIMIQTVSLTIPDQPAAGSHTWTIEFSYGSTGGARNVRSRFLSVREMKTET